MAGEAILANIVTEILKKLSSSALEEISLARGVKKELKKLQKTILMIEAVIRDAENKQVNEEAVRIWLKELRDLAYDADDILGEYAYYVMHRRHGLNHRGDKVRNFVSLSSNPVVLSSRMGHGIKILNQKFDEIARQKVGLGLQIISVGSSSLTTGVDGSHGIKRENYAFVDESKILGREVDKSNVINMLLANKSLCNRNDKISVIPIVGMGGLGKTTLAQSIYNDQEVEKWFTLRMWVSVSIVFDFEKLFINIIESITHNKFDGGSNLNVIVKILQQRLRGERFLLVLDDVWNEKDDEWNKLKDPLVVGAEGSKIIVTTRSENVASIVLTGEFPPYMLQTLGEDICLSIFEQRAFGPSCKAIKTPNLVKIGKQLVRKCGGLPLAAKALGSLMCSKKEESEWVFIRDSKTWDNIFENPNKILPALKLSYDHLPSQLKQCFSYCSMFPKNWKFERETLIQLWVAEGFIQPSQGDKRLMEEIGNEYFHILLWNSFFEGVSTNRYGEITYCKMHDLIHDLAQSVAGTHECSVMEANVMSYISEFRRLNLLKFNEELSDAVLSLVFNKSKNKLRTLFMQKGRIKDIVDNLFRNNKLLRVLDLSNTDIEELPPSIGDLKHLRYLDLSKCCNLKKLPDSITRLYNLQTLKLNDCWSLNQIPKDLNKLINLRHLLLVRVRAEWQDQLGQLTGLQTLNHEFVVPEDSTSCVGGIGVGGIGELQCLNLLGGNLKINRLDRVIGKENAERANLIAKKYIKQLSLDWRGYKFEEDESSNDSLVLEGLQPHPHLRSLEIHNFLGPKFPSWMSNLSSLRNLVNLELFTCNRCEQIPALGELPYLKYLKISKMFRLVKWLDQPLLLSIMSSSSSTPTSNFPLLESLTIMECPKLKSMPIMCPSLKEFSVSGARNGVAVSSIVRSNLDTLTNLSIKVVRELKFLPQGLLKDNNVLQSLAIHNCPDFQGFIQEEGEVDLLLSSCNTNALKELNLSNCPVLTFLPGDLLRGLTSLQSLTIYDCGKLGVYHTENIEMSDCLMLKSMPTLFPSMKRLSLENCNAKIVSSVLRSNLMHTLTHLLLSNIPGLMFLPQSLLNDYNVLECLVIRDCPDFQGFIHKEDDENLLLRSSSLHTLQLCNCPALRLLPDLKGLTSLRFVKIEGCNKQLVIVLPNGVENQLKS